MIKPHEITLKTLDGKDKNFIIHRFDCITGREILTQYPITGAPKLGQYDDNKKLMLKLLSFVKVVASDGSQLKLDSETLITNHVPDTETLVRIELEMFKYNYSFFQSGGVFEVLTQLVSLVKGSNDIPMSTDLSELSSPADKPL